MAPSQNYFYLIYFKINKPDILIQNKYFQPVLIVESHKSKRHEIIQNHTVLVYAPFECHILCIMARFSPRGASSAIYFCKSCALTLC